ncbi:MAG: Gfo/Idh/MocA family oxidoreductase [Bryobacterales bacterium]|nr:Gfo/Idh/MocA family oxidoreductase [Bryobacterales bacterium]
MSKKSDMTRRDAVKVAGAAAVAAAVVKKANASPRIQTVKAANNQVSYAVIGTGGRGQYHITHFNGLDGGKCLAVCDIDQAALDKAKAMAKDKPQGYKDYRDVLARNDIDGVLIATPLYMHFPVTRDALMAGKHVFCEKSLVFTPEEVHTLRKLANEKQKQVLQVGLQRRYSKFYQTAKQMIQKGMLGKVTHVYAQWHRQSLGKTWVPPSWRAFRKYSGGLTAELASHQIDVADWMIGSHPEFVTGVGSIDVYKDGRDVFDNIQLIFKYPGGQKLMYSSISTNKHLALFGSQRTEFGEMIMGTEGTIHITVGTDNEPATALWFYEPGPKKAEEAKGKGKEKAAVANASLLSTGKGSKGLPVLFDSELVNNQDSFLQKELKFAKLWLYKKGVMVPEEDKNPVDVQLESWFECIRTGKRPLADLEVGLEDSSNVILANLAMDEGRRVFMTEMDKMGGGAPQPKSDAKPAPKKS